ncbi:hypothetical protein CEXT_723291 [Caerostris extrusa]|uniref:Uncharacterized protein n=1 Tax=Caerostris extrusa TaxID=172846 RepID=A0AAV4XML1_CAEEX|nr:hypothetical protein CEXT_723291 [Caerostris extrusa]
MDVDAKDFNKHFLTVGLILHRVGSTFIVSNYTCCRTCKHESLQDFISVPACKLCYSDAFIPFAGLKPPSLDRHQSKTTYSCEGNELHVGCEEGKILHSNAREMPSKTKLWYWSFK